MNESFGGFVGLARESSMLGEFNFIEHYLAARQPQRKDVHLALGMIVQSSMYQRMFGWLSVPIP